MLSYSRGPDEPLWEKTIGQVLDQTVERWGDCLALVSRHQSKRYRWRELRELADCVALGLRARGISPGDRVGLWSTNCVEWVMVQLGCARAGAILVNVNPAYRTHELAFTLRKSRMKALFLWERDSRAEYARILDEARHGQTLPLEHVIVFGTPTWEEFLRASSDVRVAIQPEDVANIQYTSGTTGMPKGVMLTHRNQVNNGKFLAQGMRYTESDRICVPVPMYHCFGCVIGTMSALASGAAMIFPNWTFDAAATLEAIEAEGATSLYGVPAMFIAELGLPSFSNFNLTSLRTGMMAGAPCPVEVMKQVMCEMHCRELTIGYGQTESTPVVTMSAVDGEGWLHTGDLGVLRDDGYIHLTGRAKDMFIRGGENVYPREVEEFLYTHPKVSEVQLVGIPDERLGEVGVAWIRLKAGETATEAEIRQFCDGQIAYFKIPQHFRFVDAFPMTVTGKIQKFKIREMETKERGLENLAKRETA